MLILDGMARVPRVSVTDDALNRLRCLLTVTPDGDPQQARCGVVEGEGKVSVPRGAWTLLRDAAPGELLDLSRLLDGSPLVTPRLPDLRPYQETAVTALLSRSQGVVVAPCGSGKTVLALAAIARAKRTALVLVHTKDLAVQWQERCRECLGVEAGMIGDGKDSRGPVTVALMQALVRWDDASLDVLGSDFGIVVVDECHHVPCDTMAVLMSKLRCRRRWGLTATPIRNDGLTPMLHWILGPEVHRVRHAELRERGHIVGARVEEVQTGWTVDLKELAISGAMARGWSFYRWKPEEKIPNWVWSDMLEAMSLDSDRNGLIVNLVVRELDAGHVVLVLARLRDHCERLAELVRDRGHGAVALTGKLSAKKRKEALNALRDGSLSCVVATSLADEGLDVPRLDRLVLASPVRSAAATEQRLGRLLRPSEGKEEPVLYDLVDDVKPLRSQAVARRSVYRKILGTLVR